MSELTPLRAKKSNDDSGIIYQAVDMPSLTQPEPIIIRSTSSPYVMSSYLSESLAEVGSNIQSHVKDTQSRLVRSLSSRILPRPTVYCGICLELVDKSDVYSFTGGTIPGGLETCGHEYCKECLESYLRSQIIDFNPTPACPFTDPIDPLDNLENGNHLAADEEANALVARSGYGCGARASQADVKFIIKDPVVLAKYERVVQLKSNKNYRECPKCAHLQLPQVRHSVCNNVSMFGNMTIMHLKLFLLLLFLQITYLSIIIFANYYYHYYYYYCYYYCCYYYLRYHSARFFEANQECHGV
jgi:hypothetical protein